MFYTTLNDSIPSSQPVAVQLSFSTADIEKAVFFSAESTPEVSNTAPADPTVLMVVHGEYFALKNEVPPLAAKPLTEEAGVFRLIGTTK